MSSANAGSAATGLLGALGFNIITVRHGDRLLGGAHIRGITQIEGERRDAAAGACGWAVHGTYDVCERWGMHPLQIVGGEHVHITQGTQGGIVPWECPTMQFSRRTTPIGP
jgi:hypothetical protein